MNRADLPWLLVPALAQQVALRSLITVEQQSQKKKAGRKVPRIIQLTVALISKVVVLISILSMPTASEKRLKASNRTLAK